jgi:ribonuclease G
MVQVVKDPLGTKGARLTTDITLPSRYLVFMPGASHVGVSQRIESETERERLKKVVADYCDEQGGFIIRTAAEGVCEEDLASDAAYLKRVWTKVMERKSARKRATRCTVNWHWHSACCVTLLMRSLTASASTPV